MKNIITYPGPSKQVIVKRLKDGAYLTIPERDLYSTLKQGFVFIANDIDTVSEMNKLFGEKK